MARRKTRSKSAIRDLADKLGISYQQARALYTSSTARPASEDTFRAAASAAPLAKTLGDLLRAAADDWCADRAFSDIDDVSEFSRVRENVDWHPELEQASVSELVPDLVSVDASVVENYEGGTQAVNGSFGATLRVEGFLPHSEAYIAGDSDRVTILDADYNEHYAEVLDNGEGHLELEFSALVDADTGTVNDFEVFGVNVVRWL